MPNKTQMKTELIVISFVWSRYEYWMNYSSIVVHYINGRWTSRFITISALHCISVVAASTKYHIKNSCE